MNAQLKIITGALLCAMLGGCATNNPYSKAMDRAPTLEQKLAIYNAYVATHPLSTEIPTQQPSEPPGTNWSRIQLQEDIDAAARAAAEDAVDNERRHPQTLNPRTWP